MSSHLSPDAITAATTDCPKTVAVPSRRSMRRPGCLTTPFATTHAAESHGPDVNAFPAALCDAAPAAMPEGAR